MTNQQMKKDWELPGYRGERMLPSGYIPPFLWIGLSVL